MAGGAHDLARSIRHLQEFLEKLFTDSFKMKLQQALNSFSNLVNDPDLNGLIRELNRALSDGGSIKEIINNCNRLLQSVDSSLIQGTLAQVQKLLTEANNNDLVANICNALKTVDSINQFVSVAITLIDPAKIFLYGATGTLVGTAILKAIEIYLHSKNDAELKQLVQLSTQHLLVSIAQLRQQATLVIQNHHLLEHNQVDLNQDTALITISLEEARNILRNTVPVGIDSIHIMRIVQEDAEKMLQHLYQDRLNHEEIDLTLDRVCLSLSMNDTMKYIVYYWSKFGSLPSAPSFDRDKLSYGLAKRLYEDNSRQFTQIIEKLSNQFVQKGGNALYFSLVSGFEDSADLFVNIAQHIPSLAGSVSIDYSGLGLEAWQEPLKELVDTYRNAKTYIQNEWRIWRNPHPLTAEVETVIILRAYLQFCKEISKYFFTPYNLPRESLNGGKDALWGFYNIVRHPINTAINMVVFPVGIVTNYQNIRTNFVKGVKAHPVRVATNMTVSTLIGKGIGKLFQGGTPPDGGPPPPPPPPSGGPGPGNLGGGSNLPTTPTLGTQNIQNINIMEGVQGSVSVGQPPNVPITSPLSPSSTPNIQNVVRGVRGSIPVRQKLPMSNTPINSPLPTSSANGIQSIQNIEGSVSVGQPPNMPITSPPSSITNVQNVVNDVRNSVSIQQQPPYPSVQNMMGEAQGSVLVGRPNVPVNLPLYASTDPRQSGITMAQQANTSQIPLKVKNFSFTQFADEIAQLGDIGDLYNLISHQIEVTSRAFPKALPITQPPQSKWFKLPNNVSQQLTMQEWLHTISDENTWQIKREENDVLLQFIPRDKKTGIEEILAQLKTYLTQFPEWNKIAVFEYKNNALLIHYHQKIDAECGEQLLQTMLGRNSVTQYKEFTIT
jgi:hypothetical protein